MLDRLHRKHNKQLAIGLGVGLGAGIPATALLTWVGLYLYHLARDPTLSNSFLEDLSGFRPDMMPGYNFEDLWAEAAESTNQWRQALLRQGHAPEEVTEIMQGFAHDMATAEHIMPANAGAEATADFAAGMAGSSSESANSLAIQIAAETASKSSSSEQAITEALFKAGVPRDAIRATSEAVSNAVKGGQLGRSAFDAALDTIANAVTPAGQAAAKAAIMAVNGATGAGLSAALSAAGVPTTALQATLGLVRQAIQAARVAGTDPAVGAIGVISSVASSAGLAAAVAISGPTSERLASALRFAGVAPAAIDATAKAVADAVSHAGGDSTTSAVDSKSSALVAATNIIADAAASAFKSGSMTVYAPASSPAQAVLDVVGASHNFWYLLTSVMWKFAKSLEGKSNSKTLADILAHGPPPPMEPYRDIVFPYRRAGNALTGFPPLGGDEGKRPGGSEPGLNCTQIGTGGMPESENADAIFVADAVESFKHDKTKYLEYLRAHRDLLHKAQKAVKAAACKMEKDIDSGDLYGLAKTLGQAVLKSLSMILDEIDGIKH